MIFDEGGEIKRYEHIIVDHDTNTEDEGGKIITTAVPKLPTGDASPQTAPPDVPKAKDQQTPTLASSRPMCTTRTPIHDDDDPFTTSSYTHKAKAPVATPPIATTGIEVILDDSEHAHAAQVTSNDDLFTYADAMSRTDAAKWFAACEEELCMFRKMEVYKDVNWPANRKVIGRKWVFCIKWGPNGEIQKYKA